MHNHAASLFPIRFVDVQVDRSQRDYLARQIVAFGDQFGFRTSIRQLTPDPDETFFELSRDTIQLIASNSSDTGAPKLQFSLAFYGQFEKPPPSLAQIDPLVKSLKNLLVDVPGLKITKER